jgi:hypothetical protein
MRQIELGYGRGSLSFSVDEKRYQILAHDATGDERPLSDAEIGAALDSPIQSPPLEEIVSPGESVLRGGMR